MLSRGVVHDPGIGFITLTRVTVSPDLQIAHVYYSTMGDQRARKDTARALERATPFLRREIGSRIRLRRVPQIDFRFDESVEHQDRVEQILRDLHVQDAERAADQETPGAPDRLRRGSGESAIASTKAEGAPYVPSDVPPAGDDHK